ELRYEVHVFFDRTRFDPADPGKSPFLFRRADSGKPLRDEPIALALNDVVRVEVRARSPGTFAVDRWERMESWKETQRYFLKKTVTTKKLPHLKAVNGSLDSGAFLGMRFPGDADELLLREGANPVRVVNRPGLLQFEGAVDRVAPTFTPRMA